MAKLPPTPRSSCPISCALEVLGDKWTLLIARDMALGGKVYFNELAAHEGIATNILADRLARLEGAGVVLKSRDPADKRRWRYTLTDAGKDLIPVVSEMLVWGLKHTSGEAHPEIAQAWANDRDGTLAAARARLDARDSNRR